jgi:predicted MFS family arabinose efflux permease
MRGGLDRSWWVVAGGVCAAIHVGKLPPALPVLREALDISLVQAGFLISMVQMAAMGLGLAVGVASDALGLRRVMVAGLALLSATSAAGAFATDAWVLLALRAAEGLGFVLSVTPAPSLIRRIVPPAQLDARMGVWATHMPLAIALALLAGPPWVAAWGWPSWWWCTGLLSAAMALAIAQGVPADPPASARVPSEWRSRLAQTLGARGPWLVALAFAVYSSQWLAVVGFLPTLYAQAGLAPAWAGVASAMAAAANMVGTVAAGRLLQAGVAPTRLLRTGYSVMAVASVLLYAPVWPAGGLSWAGPFAAVLLFSAVGGLVPATLFSQAVRVAPSPATVSTTAGWMLQWSCLGQFSGPPIVAWIATQAGGWSMSWVYMASCAAVGLGLAGALGRLHSRRAGVGT